LTGCFPASHLVEDLHEVVIYGWVCRGAVLVGKLVTEPVELGISKSGESHKTKKMVSTAEWTHKKSPTWITPSGAW
jgi:hypothetical protein